MVIINTEKWNSLEQWRGTAFLIGGAISLANVALVASHVASGTHLGPLEQAVFGAAWTASFVGLLGMYPSLADQNRWLARIGAVFAVIGGITMAVMALVSLGYATSILSGRLASIGIYFLPPIIIGVVFGFGLLGIVTLRTDRYSRSVGLLFLILTLAFLFEIGSSITLIATLNTVLGVIVVLTLSKLFLGYLFRTEAAFVNPEKAETASDSPA